MTGSYFGEVAVRLLADDKHAAMNGKVKLTGG
jgi:hypothetical protein